MLPSVAVECAVSGVGLHVCLLVVGDSDGTFKRLAHNRQRDGQRRLRVLDVERNIHSSYSTVAYLELYFKLGLYMPLGKHGQFHYTSDWTE